MTRFVVWVVLVSGVFQRNGGANVTEKVVEKFSPEKLWKLDIVSHSVIGWTSKKKCFCLRCIDEAEAQG